MNLDSLLINASNLSGAGARSVATSLLPEIALLLPECTLIILLPDLPIYRSLNLPKCCNIKFVHTREGIRNDFDRFRNLYYDIPRLARELNVKACLTLGDLAPIGLNCPSIVFLHQPLFVYTNKELGSIHEWSILKRVYLKAHLFLSQKHVDAFIVQTPVMSDRLLTRYHIKQSKVHIISQPVPKHIHNNGDVNIDTNIAYVDKKIKLLFLAGYYEHKNHRILEAVSDEIRRRKLQDLVHIFTTVDELDNRTKKIAKVIKNNSDLLTNLGRLQAHEVPRALRACTALFLPTLVESYGLIYLEAFEFNKPILTSDRDFAHWICDNLAIYFDPFSAESIVNAIEAFMKRGPDYEYSSRVKQHLATFPKNWYEVASKFVVLLQSFEFY